MPAQTKPTISSLNSWKEIAAYMDRGVRTIQRWERDLGFPVHRIGKGPRSPVHAFPSELRSWLVRFEENHRNDVGIPRPRPHPDGIAGTSRVLVQRSSSLVQRLVDSLWQQRQRTEQLNRALVQVQHRLSVLHKTGSGLKTSQSSAVRPKPETAASQKKKTFRK